MGFKLFSKDLYDNIINCYFEDYVYNFYIYGDYVNEVEPYELMEKLDLVQYGLLSLLSKIEFLFGVNSYEYFSFLPPYDKVTDCIENNIIKIDGINYVTNMKYIQLKMAEYNYEFISSVNSHTKFILHRGAL